MKNSFYTIRWEKDYVSMIDQRQLPNKEIYVKLNTAKEVADAIERMIIRGAPAIGVAAAMGLALGIKQSKSQNIEDLKKEFKDFYRVLYESRPTAVNLRWGLDRLKKVFTEFVVSHPRESGDLDKIKEILEQEAVEIYNEDIEINKKMGANGKKFVSNNSNVMTYCNTGTLATAGYGTALGVIRAAFEENKKFRVYVCETRPYLQGLRLTSFELYKDDIPQTVISDNMAATLMAQKKVDAIFVGADRIAKNGDAANKIGTYSLAVNAKHHNIPFYIVAPTSTIDMRCENGEGIPIEQRSSKEVTHIQEHLVGLEGVDVYNPSFDVTPAKLITAIVTEKGVVENPTAEKMLLLGK